MGRPVVFCTTQRQFSANATVGPGDQNGGNSLHDHPISGSWFLDGKQKKAPAQGRVLATLKVMNQSGLWKDDLVDHVNDTVGGRHIGFDHLSIVHFHTPLAGFDVYFLA